MKIRKIAKKDIERCSEILSDCYGEAPYNESFQSNNASLYIESKFKNCKGSSFLIENNEKIIVGFIFGTISYWVDGKQAILEELCIDPKCQRMGYGTRLFEYINDFMKKNGVKSAMLWVNGSAPALKLYENKGYCVSKNSKIMFKSIK